VPLSVWDAASIAVKTVTYAATLGAAGAVFFLGVCGPLIAGADRPRIRSLVVGLAALSVFAGGAQILVSAGSMGDDAAGMWDGSLIHMVWQAGAGRANLIRAIGLLLAALGVRSNRPPWWALLGAAMAATSFAWTGHARALNPDVLPVLLVSAHLLGIAFWLGALAPLLIVSRNGDVAIIAATAARFGSSAVVVVGGLMAAGLALLWMLLGDVTALWTSAYGRSVMLKLAFVGCLLCFAAFNKLRLTPRLLAGDSRAVRSLRTSIRFEMILGALILAVTAGFTTLVGPPALG
jgi:putative copper resistance protein D